MSRAKKWIFRLTLCLIIIGVAYYIMLPPIHVQSTAFWSFFFFSLLVVTLICFSSTRKLTKTVHLPTGDREVTMRVPSKTMLFIAKSAAVLLIVLVVGGFVSSTQILHAGKYAQLINREPANFSTDIEQIAWSRIPTVDHDTAVRLGNRKMGEVVELVSQFNVSDEYQQVNYQQNPVRVSPLNYASFIKWITNQSNGIPYYMKVDMINGATELVKTEEGIRYSKGEYFNRNITRHLRFQFPFKIFSGSNFEIDESGHPYWVTPVYHMRIGLFGAPDVSQVILTDAINGKSELMDVNEVPAWIDRVYNANLVINQVNYNGKYQSGFINSVIGQSGVLAATEGYNYLALKDDVFLYTGITSVSADESNIGFVLINMRTKECTFYTVPSAEEFSAMESAQGAVQEKRYKATFPLLINVNERPTYFLSLKDEAGLIKMYAFIDAEDYQNVVTGTSVEEAYKTFAAQRRSGNLTGDTAGSSAIEKTSGKIVDIQSVIIDGNTVYYMLIDDSKDVYMATANVSQRLPFMKSGETVNVEYTQSGADTRRVVSIATA